jgi:hypothetical protein
MGSIRTWILGRVLADCLSDIDGLSAVLAGRRARVDCGIYRSICQ